MKPVSIALIVLIALCSLAGCGTHQPAAELAPPPAILNLPDCPAPKPPRLPQMDGSLPFDAPANIRVLLERDDLVRAYIKGLEAALVCFRQTGAKGAGDD